MVALQPWASFQGGQGDVFSLCARGQPWGRRGIVVDVSVGAGERFPAGPRLCWFILAAALDATSMTSFGS